MRPIEEWYNIAQMLDTKVSTVFGRQCSVLYFLLLGWVTIAFRAADWLAMSSVCMKNSLSSGPTRNMNY